MSRVYFEECQHRFRAARRCIAAVTERETPFLELWTDRRHSGRTVLSQTDTTRSPGASASTVERPLTGLHLRDVSAGYFCAGAAIAFVRSFATSWWSFCKASINAVLPSRCLAFTSAFAASSACTTSRWPFAEAAINAVSPSFPAAFTSAFAVSRSEEHTSE